VIATHERKAAAHLRRWPEPRQPIIPFRLRHRGAATTSQDPHFWPALQYLTETIDHRIYYVYLGIDLQLSSF
jgi:hypothetical protein